MSSEPFTILIVGRRSSSDNVVGFHQSNPFVRPIFVLGGPRVLPRGALQQGIGEIEMRGVVTREEPLMGSSPRLEILQRALVGMSGIVADLQYLEMVAQPVAASATTPMLAEDQGEVRDFEGNQD